MEQRVISQYQYYSLLYGKVLPRFTFFHRLQTGKTGTILFVDVIISERVNRRKCNLFGRNQIQHLISESTVLFSFIKACDKFCVRINASRSSSWLLTVCPARVNTRPLLSLAIGQQELMHRDVNSLILGICNVLCCGAEVNLVQMKDLYYLQGLQVGLYSSISLPSLLVE